jgi:hypothetical protein
LAQPKDKHGDRDLKETVEAYAEYIKNKNRFNQGKSGKGLGTREYAEQTAKAVFGSSDFSRNDDWGRAVKGQITILFENMLRLIQRAKNLGEVADNEQKKRVIDVVDNLSRRGGSNAASRVIDALKKVEKPLLTEADERAGVAVYESGGERFKDFTVPINRALKDIAREAESMAEERRTTITVPFPIANHTAKTARQYLWFRDQVNHEAPWDIKVPSEWNRTIAPDTFPGSISTPIVYSGMIMTPEELGNYTYGYIGAALGIPLAVLFYGSWYADGWSMPSDGEAWNNEMNDRVSIEKGFNAYRR